MARTNSVCLALCLTWIVVLFGALFVFQFYVGSVLFLCCLLFEGFIFLCVSFWEGFFVFVFCLCVVLCGFGRGLYVFVGVFFCSMVHC